MGHGSAGKARKDDGLLRSGVFEHAKDFYVEVHNLAAFEDCLADGLHARLHLGERQDGDLCGKARSQQRDKDGDESH